MPENLTPEEQRQVDIDQAKWAIRENISKLIGLTSLEETAEYVDSFTTAPF